MVFNVFYFLVDEKIKLKILACSFETLMNFENPASNPLQRTQSGNWHWKCIQEEACDSVKSYRTPEDAWSQVNSCTFSLQPMRGWHALLKVISKKQIKSYCIGQWAAFERPWKPSAHTQKALIKMFLGLQKISISWHCPFKAISPLTI